MTEEKPPVSPFTRKTAAQKVQAAEDAWNTRDPERVAQAYTVDAVWRNPTCSSQDEARSSSFWRRRGARTRLCPAEEPVVL